MTRARDTLHDWSNCDHVDDCRDVKRLLDQVEDDRVHAEAEKLRAEIKLLGMGPLSAVAFTQAADLVDPYEMRDGQLVRKSDGKPVNL